MPKITILKDVNRVSRNDYHTISIDIAKFKVETNNITGKATRKRILDEDPIQIRGWMKDGRYNESIQATYDNIFGAVSGLDQINKLLSTFGIGTLKTKAMYTQVWVDSKPMQFTFNLLFQAEDNAFEEVVVPIRRLQEMVVPIEGGAAVSKKRIFSNQKNYNPETNKYKLGLGLEASRRTARSMDSVVGALASTIWGTKLKAPPSSGLVLKDVFSSDQQREFTAIHKVYIGNFIILKDVILTALNVDWDVGSPDITGKPLSASVMATFVTRTIWTNETIKELLEHNRDMGTEPELINIPALGKLIQKTTSKLVGDITGG